jgi:hypothetical protein
MTQVLIIWFELENPAANHAQFLNKIKSQYGWARLGNTSYLVTTSVSPLELRDNLAKSLRSKDRLFVGVAPAPSAWVGMPEEVAKWIVANQH